MKNYTLKDIDEQIEKWTFRKVWMQKCDLETRVGDLEEEILQLKRQNMHLSKEPCKHEPITGQKSVYQRPIRVTNAKVLRFEKKSEQL